CRDKIDAILARADGPIRTHTVTDECIAELREAVLEFPDEPQILLRLGYALALYGEKHHGARRRNAGDYPENDTVYNAQNPYLKEALTLFEKVLEQDIGPDDRKNVLPLMVMLYGWMGRYDRAEELALSRDPVSISRECLLSNAADGEKRAEYQGNEILALTAALAKAVDRSVGTKQTLDPAYTASTLRRLADFYESLFPDGNYGEHHNSLSQLYLWCAAYTARSGDLAAALLQFDRAFDHAMAYNAVRGCREFTYTAPLIARVHTTVYDKWPPASPALLPGYRCQLSQELLDEIEKNPKYAVLKDNIGG
ncbi:MAG: hypothetical protein ACI4V1_06935, partial [Eubacteriales bacterium]